MNRQTVSVDQEGHLLLPPEVQTLLRMSPGSEVDIEVEDDVVRMRAHFSPSIRTRNVRVAIAELQAMFAGQPSLEDEYFRDRDRDKW